ncbi:bifunctional glutamine synthetase adenylyltransferase/deadenyltransferase, partial [Vibrio sp. 2132-1]|nr:bifunctional glutamine synthetase adenylyltransferase/deadenyltransferase [Vibrio sp. 2132-1]
MQLPSSLVSVAESAVQNAQEAGYLQSWPNEVVEQFHYVSALSQFITETIHRDEALAQQLPTMLSELSRHQAYRTRLAALLAECPDEMSGHRVLRQFRNREMVYIAWKDFLHAWTLEESLRHLSQLAEAMIFETYQWQYKICCAEWGTPTNAEGEAQPMLIIGMGKLGGGELNFSS